MSIPRRRADEQSAPARAGKEPLGIAFMMAHARKRRHDALVSCRMKSCAHRALSWFARSRDTGYSDTARLTGPSAARLRRYLSRAKLFFAFHRGGATVMRGEGSPTKYC